MSYVVVTGCPAPERLEPLLREIASEIGCSYNSIYRGTDARRLLEANGKHDQAWLYAHLPPGVANPPGRSTHELRSDGQAYAGPVGRRLRWWQCGIDLDDRHVAAFIRAASKRGWSAHVTYPGSAVEAHHVNLTRAPHISMALWFKWRPVRHGQKAKTGRPRWVVKRLRFLASPKDHERYLKPHGKPPGRIDDHVVAAIKRFQRDHHQKADGIVGMHTYRQMRASYRSQKAKRAKKARKK